MSRVAAIQMASGPNMSANLLEAERLIAQAVEQGARLIVLPENFAFMGRKEVELRDVAEQSGDGPMQSFLSAQARQHGVWIVGGTVPLRSATSDRLRAACMLFNDQGEVTARYDKIHLFDVRLEENGETYNESECIEPGQDIVVADSPVGRLGLAVCYDLRFPELFRGMLAKGVEVIALPAAFTAVTGRAHWKPLLRARAIENLSYVVAAAQGGYHASGRETYGHSMVIDPWGTVLDELSQGSGHVGAEVESTRMARLRQSFPALDHRRLACRID